MIRDTLLSHQNLNWSYFYHCYYF